MTAMMWDRLWLNVNLATMEPGGVAYGAIEDGAIAALDGRIAWVGPRAALPAPPARLADAVVDCAGGWLTPGLVDCHTHLVFAGHRARDFEMRLNGARREDILAAGGGIPYTVRATRAASEESLFAAALKRLDVLRAQGVTTIEIKSGYGLDRETELRQLRVARALGQARPVRVTPTYLGAHGVSPEYKGRAAEYVEFMIREMLPLVVREKLADAVDAGLERIVYSPELIEKLFQAARAHGLPVKAHTDQYSDAGGGGIVGRNRGLSADHLEYTSDASIAAMAAGGTVATLLPGATFTLRETRMPPVQKFRDAGVPMALATNCNPGSSPTTSILMMLNMGCTMFALTPEEALAGVTREGARAVGLANEIGTLSVGKAADFALWEIDVPAELSYWIGWNPLKAVVVAGKPVPLPGA
ncbi:MAG: imidazolonepropionase [Alphaproteobacteria bacterium]|nr:imidazolonepropionase [Alphaproteobacteria bacterium]